jgi:cellobiose-specific phosphotransferase system component IIA
MDVERTFERDASHFLAHSKRSVTHSHEHHSEKLRSSCQESEWSGTQRLIHPADSLRDNNSLREFQNKSLVTTTERAQRRARKPLPKDMGDDYLNEYK